MTLPKSSMGCPMDAILRLLMGPWTTYILWVLRNDGPTRFGELKRKVNGISAKVLTERLRLLESAEIIERHYQPTIPPQVTYRLARRGLELDPVLNGLEVTYRLARRGLELDPVLNGLDDIARRWHAEDAKVERQSAAAS